MLFSSSLGVTSFGIRVFSTSSVSHVAIYLGDNNVAEATGAGVQIVSLKKAMKHSDKLFVYESRTLPRNKPREITAFANKIKDSGYNLSRHCRIYSIYGDSPDVLTKSVLRGFS
ncbi:YiiX/YebB-like N1pC/P60 family cysteine hydrolase [Shigella sonnei]